MRGPALLATDLDRTLLPNGAAPESPGARERFAHLVRVRGLVLAYVTGRSLPLVEEAIAEYGIPVPHWVLADVGSTLWEREGDGWRRCEAWSAELAVDWSPAARTRLDRIFADVVGLDPQPAANQGPFKVSFFARRSLDRSVLTMDLSSRLAAEGIPARVVYSVDEVRDRGLVDVVPRRGTKQGALEFLRARLGVAHEAVLFAGDSGNDVEVLAGPLPAVLVANADAFVRNWTTTLAAANHTTETLHLARGGVAGMNGNYAAGIIEGWLHFHPEDREVMA